MARPLKYLLVVGLVALTVAVFLLYVTTKTSSEYVVPNQLWRAAVNDPLMTGIPATQVHDTGISNSRSPLPMTSQQTIVNDHYLHLSDVSYHQPPTNKSFLVTSSSSVIASLMIDKGEAWPKNSFCDEFLSHRFKVDVSPCKDEGSLRIKCFGSPFDDKMGSCTISNLAIDMPKYHTIMSGRRESVVDSNALWLVRDHVGINPCPRTDYSRIERAMAGGDWVKQMAKAASLSVPKGECQEWIEGTTFFYVGFDVHIYFKFLSWYSLHNGVANLESSGVIPNNIIRLPETDNKFLFPEFEKRLFPEASVYSLEEFSKMKNGIVCFRNVVSVPWAFSSTPFRCKMADAAYRLRSKCYNCNSRGLPGTRFQSFRRRVLNACSLTDTPRKNNEIKTIVIQLRKQYHRFIGDNPSKFSRVLKNPNELITALQKNFPSAEVVSVYPEDLSLCEQVRHTHEADVLLGVHGAGLVHLWWMQEKALLFEFVPRSQLANPTFKMLSALTGKNYYGFSRVGGGEKEVIVNIDQAMKELKKVLAN